MNGTVHPAADADATAAELHRRAAADYSANAANRNDQAKQSGGDEQ